MDRENANSNIHILTLIRPADSLYLSMCAFGPQQGCKTVMCSSIYDVLTRLSQIPTHQPVLLILRPALLPVAASRYLAQHFENLQMIGWLDAEERLSDRALLPEVIGSMVLVSSLDQLGHAISTFSKKCASESLNQSAQPVSGKVASDRLSYDLSDEEINALLGANV